MVDVNVLDVSARKFLIPDDENIEVLGASSNMIVLSLDDNESKYKVGDLISFSLK